MIEICITTPNHGKSDRICEVVCCILSSTDLSNSDSDDDNHKNDTSTDEDYTDSDEATNVDADDESNPYRPNKRPHSYNLPKGL